MSKDLNESEIAIQLKALASNLSKLVITNGIETIVEPVVGGVKGLAVLIREILQELDLKELVNDLQPLEEAFTEILTPILDPLLQVLFQPISPSDDNPQATTQAMIIAIIKVLITLSIVAVTPEMVHPLKEIGLGRIAPAIVEMGGFSTIAGTVASTFIERSAIAPLRYALNRQFLPYIPNQQDLIRFTVREDLGNEFLWKYLEWHGVDARWSQHYWDSHWELVSVSTAYQMFHKGLITEETLLRLLVKHDYNPRDTLTEPKKTLDWPDLLRQNAYSKIGYVDLRYAYENDLISRSELQERMRFQGYSPTDSLLMTEVQISRALSSERDTVMRAYQADFEYGWLTEEELRDNLTTLGYSSDKIAFYVNKSRVQRSRRLRDEAVDLYNALFQKGRLTEAELREELTSLGMTPDFLEIYVEQQKLKLKVQIE